MAAVALAVGTATLSTAPASKAESSRPSPGAETCRESRVRWPAQVGSERHVRLEVDADRDGVVDVLEAERSVGSGLSSTQVYLTLGGSGARLHAEEGFAFTAIIAINPVPKELLQPRHRGALAWIEEGLFASICSRPDPSLAWLLDPTKRLTWIDGPPEMPDSYAIRLPARRVVGLPDATYVRETKDPDGEVWLFYAGGVHAYREMVKLAREGDRVLLGTAHGVILTNPGRSRHAWIYVYAGRLGMKLRFPSIAGARLEGDTTIIALQRFPLHPDDGLTDPEKSNPGEVRVNLHTGAISK